MFVTTDGVHHFVLSQMGRNIIHGSDKVESAQHEIALWFPEGICEWVPALKPWTYE